MKVVALIKPSTYSFATSLTSAFVRWPELKFFNTATYGIQQTTLVNYITLRSGGIALPRITLKIPSA